MRFWSSLQGKLLLLFLTLDVATVGLMVALVSRDAQRALESQITAQIHFAAASLSQELNSELRLKLTALDELTSNPFIINSVIDSLGRAEYLRPFMRKLSLPGRGGGCVMIYLLDFQGRIMATNQPVISPPAAVQALRFESAPWIRKVLAQGRPHAELMKIDGQFFLLAAMPIFYQQHPEGGIVGLIDLSFTRELAEERRFTTALLTPRGEQIIGDLPPETIAGLREFHAENGNPEKPLTVMSKNEINAILPLARLFDAGRLTLVLQTSRRAALAPVAHLRERMIAASAVTAVSLTLLILWRTRIFIRPLGQLERAMETIIANQSLTSRVPVTSRDELGRIGETFNQMLEALEGKNRELEQSQAHLAMLANVTAISPLPIIMIDPDHRIQVWNLAMERLFGWSQDEVLGRSFFVTVLPPDAHETARTALQEAADQPSLSAELNAKHRDGTVIPVEITLSMIQGPASPSLGHIVVLRDIREVRRLRAQLFQSDKMAVVGRLVAGISHEINNPLGVILGFAQALERRVLPDDSLRLPVTSIVREANRCKTLVQDLLTFSRAGTAHREATDVNACVTEVLPLLESRAKTQQVEVVPELTPGLPPVEGNRNQLQQVLLNLGVNALDAMPEGGTLKLRTYGNGGSSLHIEVADTGCGIPEEIQPLIFEPFFTTKEVGEGTGIGLALVYEIVTQHGGFLELASRLREGTTFTIHLPCARRDQAEQRRKVPR